MTAVQHALDSLAEAARAAGAPALFGARDDLLRPVLRWSTWLRAFLAKHPEAASELTALAPPRSPQVWREWLEARMGGRPGTVDDATFGRALRRARHRAMLGITARELATGDPLVTGGDLSALASAAIELALAHAEAEMQRRFGLPRFADGTACSAVVLGMGKLGGSELNYSSDVDLLFVYAGDAGQTDGAQGLGQVVDLHTYHARLFAKVASLLAEVTDDGFVFRVDLDLRPEGRTGPICNSVDGLESYYETFGHAWERLAWLKARPVAGDLALGERVVQALRPFVYRRHLDYGFADEVYAMKRRIDQSGARLGSKEGFNVKLGRGGIREVEFAVQTLQLTWGGRLPELRALDTKTALSRLALAGLVDQTEADQLLGAYRFLRRIEHAVQLQEDRQTHLLPADAEGRRKVAAMLGLDEPRLESMLAEHRKRVRHAFEGVVSGTGHADEGLEASAARGGGALHGAAWDAALAAALEPELAPDQREAALGELGFARPAATRLRLEALARRPESPFHWRQVTAASRPEATGRAGDASVKAGEAGVSLATKVVKAVLATPDPDAALGHFESLFRTLQHRRAALDQLDLDPRRLRVLAGLFGSSHALSRVIVRSPGLLERLVLDGKEPPFRSRVQMLAALQDELEASARTSQGTSPREALYSALRRFKQAESLRIGFFDLAGILDTATVGHQLSDLAEVIVGALVRDVVDGSDSGLGLGVLALGRLAGRELAYGSDLDLVFVVPSALDAQAAARAARLAVTGLTCAAPEGTLYALDALQRPSGNQGPLCVSAERLREHHREVVTASASPGGAGAQTWERLAMLRARALAAPTGADVQALQALAAELRGLALGSGAADPTRTRDEVRAVRFRLEKAAPAGDPQRGRGGLVDAEIFVALHQLLLSPDDAAEARRGHAAGSPEVLEALGGLVALGHIDAARADRIAEAYGFVRQLENRLALVQEHPAESMRSLALEPTRWGGAEREHLTRLALRMGFGGDGGADPAAALQKELARHRATLVDDTSELRS